MPIETKMYLLEWENMGSSSVSGQHYRGLSTPSTSRAVLSRLSAHIVMFVDVPSDSAFHEVVFKTGADAGFLSLQPDFQKCISGDLLVLHHALLLLRDTVVIGMSKAKISFSCTVKEET